MAQPVRTFIAVELAPELRAKVMQLIEHFKPTTTKVKWVEEENLHFTIKFLGDLDLTETHQVCKAVQTVTTEMASFPIEVGQLGAFPTLEQPRTVWLGLNSGEAAFIALHDALDAELAKLHFRTEKRKFVPHLTLGRVRSSPTGTTDLAKRLVARPNYEIGPMLVEKVDVFSSQLTSKGSVYQRLGGGELG